MRHQRKNTIPNQSVTIYEYLAHNCPDKAFELVSKYGNYPRPTSKTQLAGFIKDFVRKQGKEAILMLAEIHPDRELILETHKCQDCDVKDKEQAILNERLKELKSELQTEKQMKLNGLYANMTGNNQPNTNVRVPSADPNSNYNNMGLFVATAFILLGIAYFTKK